MRSKIIKINGENKKATLLAGISGVVKIYHVDGSLDPWLSIGKQFFTVQDSDLVMKYINLKYQPKSEQEKIKKDFIKLCEVYK